MDLAWLSVAALAAVVVLSCFARANSGVLAIVMAWGLALLGRSAQDPQGLKQLLAGFNADLFLTLLGVGLLFAQAEANGALDRVARMAIRLCRGRRGLIPLMFFAVAFGLGAAGPGNIAATALFAPVAMTMAGRAGIRPLLIALMLGHGAIASTMSPFTAAGAAASRIMKENGLVGFELQVFAWNAAANALFAAIGYMALGGAKLWRSSRDDVSADELSTSASTTKDHSLTPAQSCTLLTIAALLILVLFTKLSIGLPAFAAAALISLCGWANEKESFARVPWSVIVMVCGINMLTAMMEKTGGLQRVAHIITEVSTPNSASGILALVTGIVSIYSSTTGVVLPAFLPLVKSLVAANSAFDGLSLSLSVLVGGNLVDMSPLSTIGALCLAGVTSEFERKTLYRQLMAWGFAMALAGAAFCWLCFAPR